MFRKYNFKNFINEAIRELGFEKPTEIQEKIIPKVLAGESVIGKSQTGTGKTHAFLFPLINGLGPGPETDVLILTPTRELGFQLYEETVKITSRAPEPIDVRLYVGGADREREIERLEKSQPKIVIGTIGKINDLAVTENVLKIHTIKSVVFDEADMIFESDRLADVDGILSRVDETVQILVFSATVNQELRVFLNKYLEKIPMIDLSGREFATSSVEHVLIPVKNRDKDQLLDNLLANFHPYLALTFVNTKSRADELAGRMASAGYNVGKLTGELTSRERKQILRRIKAGQFQYVVATDLAARGIDIVGASHVINYELPPEIDYFVHRVGRAGRAGFTGISYSLYDYDDIDYLQKLRAKGLKCALMDFKGGELRKVSSRSLRPRPKPGEELHRKIPLPKKVKPGYRKKRKLEIEKHIRRLRRQRIDAIYREGAKRK